MNWLWFGLLFIAILIMLLVYTGAIIFMSIYYTLTGSVRSYWKTVSIGIDVLGGNIFYTQKLTVSEIIGIKLRDGIKLNTVEKIVYYVVDKIDTNHFVTVLE